MNKGKKSMNIKDFAEVELKIPMIPDMELAATKTAEAMGEYLSFDQDKIDEVKLAIIEATINAFEHSNSDDKKVEINFIADKNVLTIKIHDKGIGYDESKVKEPKIKEKIKSDYKRGWGLSLMKELMDSVEIVKDETGCTVIMTKRRN